MNQPILLDDAANAEEKFYDLLHEPTDTVTLLLVIGEDEAALQGRQYVYFLLEEAPEDYQSIRFVFVADINLIRVPLESLESIIDDFDWNNLEQYGVLAISPQNNHIAGAVTAEKLQQKPARIKLAILHALGGDNQ